MNAHNEQHDPASPVVKQNLTTQPAAAQEAVAHLPRRSIDWLHGLHSANDATRKADAYNRPVPDEQTIPVYAAPVTAAPVDSLLVQATRATATAWREQASILKTGRKTLIRCAAELEAMVAAIHTRSTPAAPGIDLAGKSGLLRRARSLFDQDREYALERGDSLHAGQCTRDIAAIDALIDAGKSNCWPEGSYAERVERLMGMSRGEREAIGARPGDSPKGGSDFAAPVTEAPGIDQTPRPMDTAPRDGTVVRLLVQFEEHLIEDTDEPAWTIGACNDDLVQEDERIGWQVAGWCWEHDHFTEGKGRPVGWLPMLDSPKGGNCATPKGGSEAVSDAMIHAALRVQYARAGSLWTGSEANPDFTDMRHILSAAMRARAGDAEVQP